jgi:hypothetical protein
MKIIQGIFHQTIRGWLVLSTLCDMVLLAITLAIAFVAPGFGARFFRNVASGLRRLARRPTLAVVLCGFLALIVSVAFSLLLRIPQPRVHDEFSYLLAADTFVQGRLTNPTHPLWMYFESMQIIHQPSYASKYPPGQGLIMALGQVLGGHPIVGVWLSIAGASAAICWMLQAWLPRYWALLGGILAAIHPTMVEWSQNYWGGAVAALGGALLLGGYKRVVTQPQASDAFLLALGLVVLANSRPYEGMIFSILPMASLLFWMLRRSGLLWKALLLRIALPAMLVLALGAAAMGFYNKRVTGDPLLMPYQVHESTYTVAPLFIWQSRKSILPYYGHRELHKFHVDRPPIASSRKLIWKVANVVKGYFRPLVLLVPLFCIPWLVRRNGWMQFATLEFGLFIIGLFAVAPSYPHYGAPAMGLAFLLILQGMRYMRLYEWRGKSTGRFIVQASIILWLVSLLTTYMYLASIGSWGGEIFAYHRAHILKQLQEDSARHLVIVRYQPDHDPAHEWVYNEADIDGAQVVWAREMQPIRKLLEYFAGRSVWLLEADAVPPILIPYPVQ